jgi:hypothetical protein
MMMVLPEHVWRSVVDHADSIAGAVPVLKNRRKSRLLYQPRFVRQEYFPINRE